ncbi:uncharacterized protein LOC120978282 isoform X2 [Bufo bufo]|uniref:uncharacterized protein LOC120978282 isoform X2 n=1 Tax=Bufo bufo TaxID=8384 RepID=UPI001ABE84D7|nr:uncharacterized protein LOC120978282 isoform X2 [Bufo bufo]
MMEHCHSFKSLDCSMVKPGVMVKIEEEELYDPHYDGRSETSTGYPLMNPETMIKEERNEEDSFIRNEEMYEEEESPESSFGHYVKNVVVKRKKDDGAHGIVDQQFEERISSPEPSPEEPEMSRGRPVFSVESQTAYKVRHRRMAIRVDELIRQVQRHPALWKPSDPGYSDRYRKTSAWLSVCQNLYPEWDELDEGDKGILENLIQKRWRSARDQFRREVVHYEGLSGSGPLNKKPYMYLQQLMFLKPVLDLRPAVTKSGSEADSKATREQQLGESDPEVPAARPAVVASESCVEPPTNPSVTPTFQQAPPSRLPGKKSKKTVPNFSTVETFDGQVLDFVQRNIEEDPEDAFCRSLGHYIRQVPQGWRLRLRTAIQTLIEGFTPPNNPEQILGLLSQVKLARPVCAAQPMHIESTAYQSSSQPNKTTSTCASYPQSSPHSSHRHHLPQSRHSTGYSHKSNPQSNYTILSLHEHSPLMPSNSGLSKTSVSSPSHMLPSALSPSHSHHLPTSPSCSALYYGPTPHTHPSYTDSCSPDSHQSSPMNVSSSPSSPPRFLDLN